MTPAKNPVHAALADDRQLRELRRLLVRSAQRRAPDVDVEDVVQDTLAAAWVGAHLYDGRAKLATWLTSILLHKIADARRLRGRRAMLALRDADETVVHRSAEDVLYTRELASLAHRVSSRLSPRELAVLNVYLSDTPREGASTDLTMTRAHLRVAWHRVRTKIREATDDAALVLKKSVAPGALP
jgi:RNA polymerase sigma-70 factor (ECF subfamily)